MSRTDKDRPYWVQAQDNTLRTREYHNHNRFGRTYSRIRERGEKTLVEYGEHVWIFRHTGETPGMTPEEYEKNRNWPMPGGYYAWDRTWAMYRGSKKWFYERRTRWEWVGRVEVPVVTPDYCTIDEIDPRGWRSDSPCHRYVAEGYRDYRTPWLRAMLYHRPARQASRQAMERYVDEYNTFGEVDDSAWQDHQHRHALWGGGYWD